MNFDNKLIQILRNYHIMTKATALKYVCIHGHFYQPPRENPWLEELEKEDSADPCHDWNERINSECYRANTAARLVDDKNRVLSMNNNYKWLSFNFGPTLLRWIERYDPFTYQAILDADKESCKRFHGHGNAIAQAYNHLIMPLANRSDKITQVLWGIRDFQRRFGRSPEGMWLGETAVDLETLEIMADAGIKFTILSPFQADRWRFTDKAAVWHDAQGGKIPTGRAYRCRLGSGKFIHIFFYDSSISKGIAFERLLDHSGKLLHQIDSAFHHHERSKREAWLVHTATDGESYGHHFKFGDMALSAAFQELEQDPAAKIINYGAFLDSFPVRAEVEIVENTAWSCSHGLGRWQSDCGCHIGGGPEWNQKWRAPLREAMDRLRDRLSEHYEQEMSKLGKDPWKARDEYIQVMLDPEQEAANFLLNHARPSLSSAKVRRLFELLEMQRYCMFMFTSCGWFFDDISGLESTLILRYAARAIQLAEQTGADPLEPEFLRMLEKATGNLAEYGNGAEVYLKKVKPEIVTNERVVANYAIQSLARSSHRQYRIYCFDIAPQQEVDLGPSPVPCLFGHIKVKDRRTLGEEAHTYAVIHFGGLDFRCSVKPYTDAKEHECILKALQQSVEEQNTVKLIRVLDEFFGTSSFSLHDAFRDLRSSIALDINRKTMGIYTEFQSHLYQVYRPLMLSLRQWGIRIPSDLRVAVRRVLSDEVRQLVEDILTHERQRSSEEASWRETDFFYRAHMGRLHSILEDAQSWGVSLHLTEVTHELGATLVKSLKAFGENLNSRNPGELARLLDVCRCLGVKPELWRLQALYFELIRNALNNRKTASRIVKFKELLGELDDFLECLFSRFFDEPHKPAH